MNCSNRGSVRPHDATTPACDKEIQVDPPNPPLQMYTLSRGRGPGVNAPLPPNRHSSPTLRDHRGATTPTCDEEIQAAHSRLIFLCKRMLFQNDTIQ